MKRAFLILFFAASVANAQQNALMLPWTPQQFTNTNGTVLANGKVCTYQAGTSTGLATYTDSTASVANNVPPNAILLDSTGRPTSGGIWLKSPLAYKIVVLTAGSDSTCNTGVTIKTQDQVITGSGAGLNLNNTFTGPNSFSNTSTFTGPITSSNANTFSGTNTFSGLTSIKNQSNVRWVDGTAYACSDVGLNAAIADVVANDASGGTVYARCPGTNTIAATVNVGSATSNVALVLLGHSTWNCTINNAPQDCWFLFPGSTIEGPSHGVNFQQLTIGGAASVRSIVKTFSHVTPGVASHLTLKDLEVHNQSSGTVANALVDIQGAYDSSFWNLYIDAFGGRGLWIHDFTSPAGGNSLSFYNLLLDGQNRAGARPLVIEQTASGSNTSPIHFFGGDWGHPGAGQFLVELNGHAFTGFGQITLSGLYMESNSTDNSTAIIQATDVGQLTLSSVRIVKLSGSSTATGLSLTQGGSNLLYGITATGLRVAGGNGGSSNAITNNQNGGFTIPQTSNVVPFYAYQSSDGGEISQFGPLVVNPDGSLNLKNTAAPPGAGTASQEKCYYDTTAQARKCSYNNGTFFQIPQVLTATSAAFATATTAGTCVQNATAVTNAATSMAVSISPVSTPGVGAVWSGFVSSAGNVTINECAVATSAGGTIAFNIRVTP